MAKKIYLAIIVSLSIGSITLATFVAQRTTRRGKAPVRKGQTRRKPRQASAPAGPVRPADPNRAPQNLVDEALYTNEEFFGTQASVARPYAVAFERVGALLGKYPKDPRLHLYASRLAERLEQFDKARTEINEYADLRNRSADALRRLADFYHHRARFADEVKTLLELAKARPAPERAPIYKRAAELVRTRSLKEFKPADFFAELVAADPSNIQPVKDYVEELQLSKRYREALAALAFTSRGFLQSWLTSSRPARRFWKEAGTAGPLKMCTLQPLIRTGLAHSRETITNFCDGSAAIESFGARCRNGCGRVRPIWIL